MTGTSGLGQQLDRLEEVLDRNIDFLTKLVAVLECVHTSPPRRRIMPDHNSRKVIVSDVLLRRLVDLLTAQGLEVRNYDHGDEIIQIAVINPRDPDRGRVVMGYDGYLVWEYWSAFKTDSDVDACAEMICALLTKNIGENQKPAGGVDPWKAPARVTLDAARAGPSAEAGHEP